MRPRVALIAASSDIGGGQAVQASILVEELRRDGHPVTFMAINPRFPSRLRWLYSVPYGRTLVNEALYLSSLARLARADVAHIFSASYWSFLLAPMPAILAARSLGKRTVLHYHSGEADDHLTRWGVLVHPWLRLVQAIVVPSDYLRTVFARHGYRACVIPNVVDTSRFRYRERVPLRPRLFCNRSFEPHYRIGDILEAFVLLKASYPEATLTLAGSGSEDARLRELAADTEVDGIRFVGPVSPSAMPGLYDDADVFVNASIVDNQPVSVLEAFAAGLGVTLLPAVVELSGPLWPEQCLGEEPLVVDIARSCDLLVQIQADSLGETDVEVMELRDETRGLDVAFEETHGDRRGLERHPRHADQRH